MYIQNKTRNLLSFRTAKEKAREFWPKLNLVNMALKSASLFVSQRMAKESLQLKELQEILATYLFSSSQKRPAVGFSVSLILFYEKFLDISSNADFFFRDIVIHFEVIVNISVNILESKDRK